MYTPLRGLLALLIFFTLPHSYALDLGDGTDGACNWDGVTPASVEIRLWQCQSLNITGTPNFVDSFNNQTGNDFLDIRVQQDVLIDGEINLSATGTTPGFGGHSGGSGAAGFDGDPGGAPSGIDANGKGGLASSGGFSGCAGAGGSGGRHSGLNAPISGVDAGPLGGGCSPSPTAAGGPAPTASYSNPNNLNNEIFGGAGGGAGGSAYDGATDINGGDGGGGGGILRVLAGGSIEIATNAFIHVDADNGQNGVIDAGSDGDSGGGGGGAGGTIYLSTLRDMTVTGTPSLSATNGSGGTTESPGGNGSDGDVGIIRLEDGDGDIPGASGISSPSASVSTNPTVTSQSQLSLESDISAGCAIRSVIPSSLINLSSLFGLALVWLILIKFGRFIKINNSSL
jgi:hypothetical protein